MTNRILSTSNLYEPNIDGVMSLLDKFSDSSGNLMSGCVNEELEYELSKYHNSKFCVSLSSGFWALVASIMIKSIKGRGEIIMPSLTYRRLADVVYWTKHVPVFIDVDFDTLSISPDVVRQNITENTALILAVHPIVNCCDVTELIDISENYNVPIIFDAVESVHETYSGKRIGSFNVGEIFSLHASKLINGMEGGYVCTNDDNFAEELRSFGIGRANSLGAGIDSRLNSMHALMSLASLNEINKNVAHNKKIYMCYKSLLSKVSYVRLLEFDEEEQSSYKNIVIEVLDGSFINRDDLVSLLNDHNILARSYYSPPLHRKSSGYKTIVADMKNTEYAKTAYMNLPCGYRVEFEDVERVCNLINRSTSHEKPTK